MTNTIDADFYVGDIGKGEYLSDHLPEHMLECGEMVRTHTVENIRWVDEHRTVDNFRYGYEGLVADVMDTVEHGGNECCGGANVMYSSGGKFYIREVSFGH